MRKLDLQVIFVGLYKLLWAIFLEFRDRLDRSQAIFPVDKRNPLVGFGIRISDRIDQVFPRLNIDFMSICDLRRNVSNSEGNRI